jgi:hypothetical protein
MKREEYSRHGRRSETNGEYRTSILGKRSRPSTPRKLQFHWADNISDDEWEIYLTAIRVVRDTGVPFLLGGGFALATFTGRWRDTKDIDFYIRPKDKAVVVAALTKAGFADYYSRLKYDRRWIHRNVKSDVIVDIIWSMANQRAQVDEIWFKRAAWVTIRGEKIAVLPMEEFLWCKLYILQRDHCDWTDIFNLLYARGPEIDWRHLMNRLEEDTPLLRAMLTVYGWLRPNRARRLPKGLWKQLQIPAPTMIEPKWNRVRLLDSRLWFAALAEPSAKLEV